MNKFNVYYCNDADMWADEIPPELCDGMGCPGCESSSGFESKGKREAEFAEANVYKNEEPCTDPDICHKCGRPTYYDSYFKKMVCRQCGFMSKPKTESLTIGYKIRESNESLAEFITKVTERCCDMDCTNCPITAVKDLCDETVILDYLNQPYTE